MTEQEKNLIALLDSSDEANIALALILQQQLQSPVVEKRINDYQKMLQLYAATDKYYDTTNTLSEGLPLLNFHSFLSDSNLPDIFSIQYYAWGGQSYGFEETPEYIEYSIYRALLHFNLEDWFVRQKTDSKVHERNRSKNLIQIWVTYRFVEILPLFELLAKHCNDTPDMDYYFGEIYFERGDYCTAQRYFTKYVDAVPDGVSAISRYSDIGRGLFYKNEEYAPEAWHLLPQQHWSILKINTISYLGSTPAAHAFPPNTMEARMFLAQIASKQNDLIEAERQYDSAIALCPEHWLAPHLQLAELLLYSQSPNPDDINKAVAHLHCSWQNIALIDAHKYTCNVSAWYGWQEEYGKLAQYLTLRYPLLYTGINYYYLAERYFLAAEHLRQLKANSTIVFELLHTSSAAISTAFYCHDLKQMTDETNPNTFYNRRPRLIFELLEALKHTS
jgi:tetratricopeptide (TPR) repeat protein